jgi:hypothetical protein
MSSRHRKGKSTHHHSRYDDDYTYSSRSDKKKHSYHSYREDDDGDSRLTSTQPRRSSRIAAKSYTQDLTPTTATTNIKWIIGGAILLAIGFYVAYSYYSAPPLPQLPKRDPNDTRELTFEEELDETTIKFRDSIPSCDELQVMMTRVAIYQHKIGATDDQMKDMLMASAKRAGWGISEKFSFARLYSSCNLKIVVPKSV